jgi:hypothetical protein
LPSSALLPFWVEWGRWLVLPPLAFALTWILARLEIAWLRPRRKDLGALHWTERARLSWPLQRAPVTSALGVTTFIVFVFGRGWRELHRLPPAGLALATLAAVAAAYLLERRRVLALLTPGEPPARASAILIAPSLRLGALPFLLALFAIPREPRDARWLAEVALALAGALFFALGGWLRLARALGIARPARERAQALGTRLASATGAPIRSVWEIDLPEVRPMFQLALGRLILPSRLLELGDAELEALLAATAEHLPSRGGALARAMLLPLCALALYLGPSTSWISLGFLVPLLLWLRLTERETPARRSVPVGPYLRALEWLSERHGLPMVVSPAQREPEPVRRAGRRRHVAPVRAAAAPGAGRTPPRGRADHARRDRGRGGALARGARAHAGAPVAGALRPDGHRARRAGRARGRPGARRRALPGGAGARARLAPLARRDRARALCELGRCDAARAELAAAEPLASGARPDEDERRGDLDELLEHARDAVDGCR